MSNYTGLKGAGLENGAPPSLLKARARPAFTLIELLVVITIIVVLLALLVPAMDKAISRAELTICATRHHGMTQIFVSYAAESKTRKFPSGKRDNDGYEHLPFVSKSFMQYVETFTGNNKKAIQDDGTVAWGTIPSQLVDPSFADTFGYKHATYGAVIGYIYLGNHPNIESANNGTNGYPVWKTAKGLSDPGNRELSVCWNEWTLGITNNATVMAGQFTVAAHVEGGGPLGNEPPVGGHFYHSGSGQDPRLLGAIGGNVGFADGSTSWRDIKDMHERVGASGSGEQNTNYPTLW